MKLLTSAHSPYLAVASSADAVLHTYSHIPDGILLFYEIQTQPGEMQNIVKNRPLYFIWIHHPPACNSLGVPVGYEKFYRTAETIYSADPDYGPGLLLLK
jgi:hypothetical protein